MTITWIYSGLLRSKWRISYPHYLIGLAESLIITEVHTLSCLTRYLVIWKQVRLLTIIESWAEFSGQREGFRILIIWSDLQNRSSLKCTATCTMKTQSRVCAQKLRVFGLPSTLGSGADAVTSSTRFQSILSDNSKASSRSKSIPTQAEYQQRRRPFLPLRTNLCRERL